MDILLDLYNKSRWLLGHSVLSDNGSGKAFLEAAVSDLRDTQKGLEMEGSPVIAFCGKTNVGKSTLLNAVLGGKIAPVYNGDWSSRPVEYRYSDPEDQLIFLADHYPPQQIRFNSEEQLSDALLSLATMENPEQSVGKQHMIVRISAPILEKGLIICDMPGFLATTGEDEDQGTHDNDIRKYLENWQTCLRTFIVSDAEEPDGSVIEFIKENMKAEHLSIIINYRSLENIDERKENLEGAWRSSLNRILDFHYINAKKALNGDSDERELLLNYLQDYSNREGRREIALKDLVRVFSDTGLYLKEFLHCRKIQDIFEMQRLMVVQELVRESENQELIEVFNKYYREEESWQ